MHQLYPCGLFDQEILAAAEQGDEQQQADDGGRRRTQPGQGQDQIERDEKEG